MAIAYGKTPRRGSGSPSSTAAVSEMMAALPHSDLLRPKDAATIEEERRAIVSNEAREFFKDGLLAHEILEQFPDEPWMAEKIGEWEVVYRREQIAFIEGQDKPAPKFAPTPLKVSKPSDNEYLPLPALAVDLPDKKAVAINVTAWRSDTGEGVEMLVWLPRSQIKGDTVAQWIVDKKREEIEAEYPVSKIDGLP